MRFKKASGGVLLVKGVVMSDRYAATIHRGQSSAFMRVAR
jgi:hypothetical protein